MNLTGILVGIGLTVSVIALTLALWPVVADAPWDEKQEVIAELEVAQEPQEPWKKPSRAEFCLHIVDLLGTARDVGARILYGDVWKGASCWNVIRELANE